ncbi:MAG: hypothetical protein EOM05_06360 [Clostridia bacterium]|nr:hypothetical protein [Clostridia bacterium]
MFKIVIYGECNKNLIGLKLCRTLSHYGGVLYFCGGDISEVSVGTPCFIVYETECINSLQVEDAVIIFNNSKNENCPKITSSCNISCIVNSQDSQALSNLLPISLPAIVYGMSAKDSITISSINENSAVISVQRELVLQSGKILEPCEFKVLNIESLDKDDILTICSVLILFEKFCDGIIKI